MSINTNPPVASNPGLVAAARKNLQQATAEFSTPVHYNRKETNGGYTELPLTLDAIDSLTLSELASAHQKRPLSGTSLQANAWPMLPLTSPIQSDLNRQVEEARSKEGVWIGKGQWLPRGEMPPQVLAIDTGVYGADRRAYTNHMMHVHGGGTHHIDQVR